MNNKEVFLFIIIIIFIVLWHAKYNENFDNMSFEPASPCYTNYYQIKYKCEKNPECYWTSTYQGKGGFCKSLLDLENK
jgi:hypothetical protein